MKTVPINKATAPLADYVQDLQGEPLILTVRGRPVAALVALPNTDAETAALSTNPSFLAIIKRSRRRYGAEGGISSKDMRRRLRLKKSTNRS